MPFQNVLVTGANRGIGLEFVKQLLAQNPLPKHLIATIRKDSEELNDLKASHDNLHILSYDATNYDSYDHFVNQVQTILGDDGLDLLINNAGIFVKKDLSSLTPQDILQNVEVNAVAPLFLTKSLLPLLKLSSSKCKTVVVNITARIGSIGENNFGGHYAYRTSKVSLNMISKSLAIDLKPYGITVLALNPGWVLTDMGGPQAQIDTATSVAAMLAVITNSQIDDSGSFVNYDGKQIPY